jgi:hypothetical protein
LEKYNQFTARRAKAYHTRIGRCSLSGLIEKIDLFTDLEVAYEWSDKPGWFGRVFACDERGGLLPVGQPGPEWA